MVRRGIRSDTRASKTVIAAVATVGVVSMLSLTVGAYVFGVIPTFEAQPHASFDVDQHGQAGPGEASATVDIEFQSGERLAAENLEIRIDGTPVETADSAYADGGFSGLLDGGSTATVVQPGSSTLSGGEEITVVYSSGDESFVLASHVVNEDG